MNLPFLHSGIVNEVFDPRDILEALDRVLGKRLAFRFKVVPNNTSHSFSQLFQDETLIKFVHGKLPNCDLQDEVELSMSSVHKNNDVIDSVSYLVLLIEYKSGILYG
ncbi:hypothetical protein JHK82_034885 [Glycine max]|nr:hypothetical protein JHK85_035593 [Glycine max]KAG5111616.1 hypothetical protein JHK82_034885 [Glycine max]